MTIRRKVIPLWHALKQENAASGPCVAARGGSASARAILGRARLSRDAGLVLPEIHLSNSQCGVGFKANAPPPGWPDFGLEAHRAAPFVVPPRREWSAGRRPVRNAAP